MIILGINDGHNAAACLYEDGQVVAAIQEERLRRVKNWHGMPSEAIATVLGMRGISLREVDFVAVNGHHAAFPMTKEELLEEYRTINDLSVTVRRGIQRAIRRAVRPTPLYRLHRERRQRDRVRGLLEAGVPWEKIVFVDHHTAHAAAAYYGLGNFEDDILVLTCDGAGDGLCATVSTGRRGRIERLHQVEQGHSIGNIYAMITFLMGMVPLEHEYKLMGLAPYADPRGAERVYEELSRLIRFDPANPFGWTRAAGCPPTYQSYRFFRDLLERKRFDWVAGGLQKFAEVVLCQWVQHCVKATGIRRLALGGGIFMNVKVNKLILELPEVEEAFVYPSCGDETNAIGAAYWVYADRAGTAKMDPLRDLYWGPEFSDEAVEGALRGYRFTAPVKYEQVIPIEPAAARLLAEGKIVARYHGREEFGARALGNRAILANPSESGVVRVINEAIKARDFWMPFAPSILEERSASYLVKAKPVRSPYMIMTFDTTSRFREIQAAIHPFDRTARPQEVSRDWNPSYHALLTEFERLTGIGGVLCTSFNLHGYPIVSRPEDALEVFDRSGLTHLAIGNWLVTKS
jgi:carbamoyltransferase